MARELYNMQRIFAALDAPKEANDEGIVWNAEDPTRPLFGARPRWLELRWIDGIGQ